MIEKFTTGSFFTNSYIISNEKNECIIVDPGLNYRKVAEYIKEKYIPKAILITHGHVDHIDGINYFLDLPIYISEKEIDSFYDTYESLYDMVGRINPFNEGMLDIRKLRDGDIINLIGYEIKVIETPGHTNGSICFLIGNDLFSGDTLFNESIGRTDFPNGDYKKMEISLKKLMELNDDINVYPGHNEKTTIGYEKYHNPFLN